MALRILSLCSLSFCSLPPHVPCPSLHSLARNTAPDQNAPTQFDSQAPSRDQNLSERLHRSDGVIRPRKVDPEMHVPPPLRATRCRSYLHWYFAR
jgi:hypothetical protein